MLKSQLHDINCLRSSKSKKRKTWMGRRTLIFNQEMYRNTFSSTIRNDEGIHNVDRKNIVFFNKAELRRLSCASQAEASERLYDYETFLINSLVGVPRPAPGWEKRVGERKVQQRRRSVGVSADDLGKCLSFERNLLEETEPPSPMIRPRY